MEEAMEILMQEDVTTDAAVVLQQAPPVLVSSCTLEELFSGHIPLEEPEFSFNGKLAIPEYQRPYVWGKKQLEKLCLDLAEFVNKYEPGNPYYYLGSIIIHQDGDKLNIIDGQQRITSLLLLLAAKQVTTPCAIVYSSPLSVQRIKENLAFLNKNLAAIPEIDLRLLNVTLVITQSEDDAYTFFETQNTGGKRLSGADIVKSHHLRAIKPASLVGVNAKKWESKSSDLLAYIITLTTKARFWNVLFWKDFPFYKEKVAIKNLIVEEFTEKTLKGIANVSYLQVESHRDSMQNSVQFKSQYKAIRQPLYDGENYIDFISEFADLYDLLFIKKNDHRIDYRFYAFRQEIITGKEGTIFLKEFLEVMLVSYVSKFGLQNIFEFALWAFRYIYSLRVTKLRTVREDTMTSFVKEQRVLDKVLSCFTHEQVVQILKSYNYDFNKENCGENNVKGKYIRMLSRYFQPQFTHSIVTENFDERLKQAINDKLKAEV
ncbi:DUF262 domain-containing protein [Rufibacter aurantiacus]|uniref:DUF262 domain-containing protein n=1 Tax=Rufibacter aurantiacus TaxID=2817374 RepID=UPI001B314CDC|nr:DUF262 domain-containing protein [Rufibacter aurantiacus]